VTEKTESHVHLPVDDAADASRASTSQTVGGSDAVSAVQDTLLEAMDETAAMLRGMTMDPAIPSHAKSAMWVRIGILEKLVEANT
jgi:hypothetical protein